MMSYLWTLPSAGRGFVVALLAFRAWSSTGAFVKPHLLRNGGGVLLLTSTMGGSLSTPRQQQRRQQHHQHHQQRVSFSYPIPARTSSGTRSRADGVILFATSTGGGDDVVVVSTDTTRADIPPMATTERKEKKSPNLSAYWEILRPNNIPASFGLVAAGALVASHTAVALLEPKVLLTAFAAAAVSVGSCVLNDWFDIELDRVNEPERPLVTGEVVPVHALGIGVAFLLAAVASASFVNPAALQATIVASVALTLAYTPLLKPIPLVKNFVVAMVIAAAIAAGGLAAGAGVASTLTPSVLTFFVIGHREVLMDIADVEGDREAGVRTLPVLMGRQAALVFATALLSVGVGAAGVGILKGACASRRSQSCRLGYNK
ncbi:unnamed protein product [Ectocarpus sp. 12 AP-2014]